MKMSVCEKIVRDDVLERRGILKPRPSNGGHRIQSDLKARIVKLGLSYAKFADIMGISRQSLYMKLQGFVCLTDKDRLAIEKLLRELEPKEV